MRWNDFLYPERALAFAAKIFGGILAALIASEVLSQLLSGLHLSCWDELLLCLALVAISPVAYLIREHRLGRGHARRDSRRGAERTPHVPPDGGED